MESKNNFSTKNIGPWLLKLMEEAFSGNPQRLELLSLSAVRALKSDHPDIAHALGSIVAKYSGAGSLLRLRAPSPPPADIDAGLALLRIQPTDDANEPILNPFVQGGVERFIAQRSQSELLIREGFAPPRTILLQGPPGTGKTMLAKWLAKSLDLPFVVLDLATSISSFLGKTGSNLRRSLDYARATPCVLLIDEFDAIGKRRDDSTEVGELKRIVNVLLKELEDWPFHSVLVAATNHPELLDPAINRRFDVVLSLPLPNQLEREKIITRSFGQFAKQLPEGFISAISQCLKDCNGSELETISQSVVRRHLVEQGDLAHLFIESAIDRSPAINKEGFSSVAKLLKNATNLSVREIARIMGKSSSAVQYQLKKKDKKQNIGGNDAE